MLGFDKEAKHFTRDGKAIELTQDQLKEMSTLSWWQKIPFSTTLAAPGRFDCAGKIKKYWLDRVNFEGQSVLGIGCHEGFPLYYVEAMGASRVVGLTDDFAINPEVTAARNFTKRVLGSKVEFINKSIYELSPHDLGVFDVVLFFDALPHVRHPLLAMEKVAAMAKAALFICTPFVLSSDPNPWSVLLPNFNEGSGERNLNGVNRAWVEQAIERVGFRRLEQTVHEFDYLSIIAARDELRPPERSFSEEELPTDHGLENKTAILVMSCERYRQVWEPFFYLFKKYFPDCPYRVYFCTDHGTVKYPGVTNIELGVDRQWAGNAIQAIEQIDAEQIILFQEDFLFCRPADTTLMRKLARHALDFNVGCIRLFPIPPPTGKWKGTPLLGTIGPFDDFRYSFQLTLWNKRVLRSLLSEGDDPWTTEFVAARRSIFCPEPFLALCSEHRNPLPYLAYAVDQGEWSNDALALMKREDVPMMDITKRIARIQRK